MGESCEEGGPSPSHKIPQEHEDWIKYSKQFYIHLPKDLNTIKFRLADVLKISPYRLTIDTDYSPSHVDVSSL